MLIDFHTHVFPDKLAPRTLEALKLGIKNISGFDAVNYHDGTVGSLLSSMDSYGVDISVTLPIATRVTQSTSINSFAASICCDRLISFAAIHPMQPDACSQLDIIKEMGFLGIKLHPEFQQVYIDSPEAVKLLCYAEKLKLYTVIHAGCDVGLPPPVHASPERISHLLEYISGRYFIAAHLGGFGMWDQVEKHLVGKSLYMDTAAISSYIESAQYKRIIQNHGSEKILFGSDNPWENPTTTLKKLTELDLDPKELDNITYKNAMRILKL